MLVIGAVGLWIAVPIGWLYIGSLVQVITDSVSWAIAVMFAGVIASIALLVKILLGMNRTYRVHYYESHHTPPERSPLEPLFVILSGAATCAVGFWFLILTGPPAGL